MRQPEQTLPIGIVIRKAPSASPWVKWVWTPVAIIPGAAPACWKELRRDGDTIDYHAATLPLELWRTDAEAYRSGLSSRVPTIAVLLRETTDPDAAMPIEPVLVTASPYEAQDYADTGDDIIELVPMPDGLIAMIQEFVEAHYVEEVFKKRKRDKKRVDLVENGVGDARIDQLTDVYRAPGNKPERLH